MKRPEPNLLVQGLAALCEAHRLEEKWLVAPDWWIGHQWVDAAARSGQSALNLRVKTLSSLALEMAAPELARRGTLRISALRGELLVGRLYAEQAEASGGYLAPLAGSPGLVEALHRTLSELRLAGLDARTVSSRRFEVESKGQEIRALLGRYERALDRDNLADLAGVLRIAAARLRSDPDALPAGALVLIARDARDRLAGLALDLWKAIPEDRTRVLAVDEASGTADSPATVTAAVGEAGEIRAVLRRLVEERIPFDDVEILHTDTAVYVPLVHEIGAAAGVGLTFAEGIPVRYARPARALAAWIDWIEAGFPRPALDRMIRERLVEIAPREPPDRAIDRLAFGVDRTSPARAVYSGAVAFLQGAARCADRFDRYGIERLENELSDLARSPEDEIDWISDPFADLRGRIDQAHVLSGGPRPGAIHVASLWHGGHSGRGHTFIVGLDDTRFPGRGLQDPLLLDQERRALSPELTTSAGRLAQKIADFDRLRARLRGRLFLSFPARSLDDGRRLFPSPALVAAFRRLSGEAEIDSETLLARLPAPESFAPGETGRAIDLAEWWLARACGDAQIENPERVLAEQFCNLRYGQAAAESRASDRFTEYDGYVPEAKAACDPFGPTSRPVSATRLERLGKSPLDYFFSDVLEIAPPEDRSGDPEVWLDPAEHGKLLHALFRVFMQELGKAGERPDFDRHRPLIDRLLADQIAAARAESPPPSEPVLERQAERLRRTAHIFLREEARAAGESAPVYFEASIGLPPEGDGSPVDSLEPVAVALPGGRSIRARGRIDRIDRVGRGETPRFAVWDYKTGSAYGIDQGNPNREGRVVQNTLYAALADARLKAIDPSAEVASFGYLLASPKHYGKRVPWTAGELEPGKQAIAWLCELLASGCFPATVDPKDIEYSDYRDLYGDPQAAAADSKRKAENPANRMLEPFARLRKIEPGGGDG